MKQWALRPASVLCIFSNCFSSKINKCFCDAGFGISGDAEGGDYMSDLFG